MEKPMTYITVYRAGSTPQDYTEWEEWALRFGSHEMPILYAHTDRDLVQREYATTEYARTTRVQEIKIDLSKFLDARTPDGLALWHKLGRKEERASAAGYSGVIYPDPHDWECNGHEVALWDPDAALFPGELEEAA